MFPFDDVIMIYEKEVVKSLSILFVLCMVNPRAKCDTESNAELVGIQYMEAWTKWPVFYTKHFQILNEDFWISNKILLIYITCDMSLQV